MVYLTIMTRIWDFSQIAAVTPNLKLLVLSDISGQKECLDPWAN